MIGQGKYDEVATAIRIGLQAQGVLVVVLNGKRGSGFSVQVEAHLAAMLPEILEETAREMRRDISDPHHQPHQSARETPRDPAAPRESEPHS